MTVCHVSYTCFYDQCWLGEARIDGWPFMSRTNWTLQIAVPADKITLLTISISRTHNDKDENHKLYLIPTVIRTVTGMRDPTPGQKIKKIDKKTNYKRKKLLDSWRRAACLILRHKLMEKFYSIPYSNLYTTRVPLLPGLDWPLAWKLPRWPILLICCLFRPCH